MNLSVHVLFEHLFLVHELPSSHPHKNELAKISRQSEMNSEVAVLFAYTATADRGRSGKCVFNIVEAPEGVPKRFDNRLRL